MILLSSRLLAGGSPVVVTDILYLATKQKGITE